MADLIRDILTGIGAVVVAVFTAGAVLWAHQPARAPQGEKAPTRPR